MEVGGREVVKSLFSGAPYNLDLIELSAHVVLAFVMATIGRERGKIKVKVRISRSPFNDDVFHSCFSQDIAACS